MSGELSTHWPRHHGGALGTNAICLAVSDGARNPLREPGSYAAYDWSASVTKQNGKTVSQNSRMAILPPLVPLPCNPPPAPHSRIQGPFHRTVGLQYYGRSSWKGPRPEQARPLSPKRPAVDFAAPCPADRQGPLVGESSSMAAALALEQACRTQPPVAFGPASRAPPQMRGQSPLDRTPGRNGILKFKL